jgi:hypothetical protein
LVASARRQTGLWHFGAPPIEPALSVLVESLEGEANLHPLGRFLMWVHLKSILETRLRLQEEWNAQHEALENCSIRQPIFIIGMPRTGSTFLHELLAQDPDNRAPRAWEVMFPISTHRPRKGHSDPRIRKAAACLWWFRRLAPEADAVYPIRAGTPHECVAIHSYTMMSEEFISTCHVPSYEDFLHASDLGPVYSWEKRFLQHLQLGGPQPKRWVLKCAWFGKPLFGLPGRGRHPDPSRSNRGRQIIKPSHPCPAPAIRAAPRPEPDRAARSQGAG